MHETQFNLFEGERLKEQGMQRAKQSSHGHLWVIMADKWLRDYAPLEFTSDDVVEICGPPGTGANKCNVVGAWISGLSKSGRIRFTGQFRKSSRAARHAGIQRIWRKIK